MPIELILANGLLEEHSFLGDMLVSWMSKEAGTVLQCHSVEDDTWRYLQFNSNSMQTRSSTPVPGQSHSRTSRSNVVQYLVRRIGMRCLTPAELEVLTKESA
ncbi:hypothetical protein Tco_0912913 [Tanacetum coccineum]